MQLQFLEEPMTKKKKAPSPESWLAEDVLMIYDLYPRKVARAAALTAIRKALTRLAETEPEPVGWLVGKVQAFAVSPKGQAGQFCPHPATWFNQERYLDGPGEWGISGDGSYRPAGPTGENYDNSLRRYT